jgi:hypothetical protein
VPVEISLDDARMDSNELTMKNAVAELKLTPLRRVGDGGMRGLNSILKFGGRIEV